MRYDQAAILSDLDGTLLNCRGEVSAEDRAAVRDFIAGGGLFGIATGREPRNARLLLPGLPLNAPSIVLNGAAVYDFAAQRVLCAKAMDKEAARSVLRHCKELSLPLDIQIYTAEGIFYATPLETAEADFLRIHQPASFMPPERLAEKDWFKMILLEREAGALAPMREYLRQAGLSRRLNLIEGTTDIVSVGKYQELLPQDVTKATGVAALRALPAYAGRTIFAAGDYWNDMELLRAADVPCAPDNAIDEIKALSKHVLSSNNESPIADLIRRVIPAL